MRNRIERGRTAPLLAAAALLSLSVAALVYAQPPQGAPPQGAPPQGGRGGGGGGRGAGRGPQTPQTPKSAAPIDLTGYWVSIVTEDWLYRMVTPAKGDYSSVPINAAGRQIADAWDPAKDEAAGEQCKAYGAPFLMRLPGRFHITWADDNTMKIEADYGTQTRLFHFNEAQPQGGAPTLQGDSAATWEGLGRGGRGGGPGGFGGAGAQTGSGPPPVRPGSLKAVTTHLKPGYLRKNGVPYGANTVLTEYYDMTKETNGDSWLIVTTIVNDPEYLTQEFITSTHFKKLADSGPGWNPSPCAAK